MGEGLSVGKKSRNKKGEWAIDLNEKELGEMEGLRLKFDGFVNFDGLSEGKYYGQK